MIREPSMLLRTRPFTSRLFLIALLFLTACLVLWHIHTQTLKSVPIPSYASPNTTTFSSPSPIPAHIWYKVGPSGLNPSTQTWTNSCITQNPNYEVTFLDDNQATLFVNQTFGDHPSLISIYNALPLPILKADLLRYLLLYQHGGVWLDLDVSCFPIPISEWIPPQFRDAANLVVGWEFDVGWDFNFVRQFVSWTIMARPGSQHLWKVVEDVLTGIEEKCRENEVSVGELTMGMIGDVVDLSGPRRLTRSVVGGLGEVLGEETVAEKMLDLKELLVPSLVGDVLVLPGFALAKSSNTYANGTEIGSVLVEHHYAGSWKNEHGGEVVSRRW